MEQIDIERNLRALQALYPGLTEDKPQHLPMEQIKGLPVWMRENIRVLKLPMKEAAPFYLVIPKPRLAFEHLMRIYQLLHEKLGPLVLVIADRMPPKHRPLLVKFRIPFIYKNESVFVPDLGLKIGRLKKFEDNHKLELADKKEGLTPFAFKIVAGLLTNQIPEEFTQKLLLEKLQYRTKISASKLSPALTELTEHDLLFSHGAGPTKSYTQENHQKTWEKVLLQTFAPFFKEVETNYLPKPFEGYIVAGESALARYSNLAHPNQNVIAVTTSEFRQNFKTLDKMALAQERSETTLIQVWKEDPALFAIKGAQNPIEVFFSLQRNTDERVQLSLDEMLKAYGLHREKE
ncbi:MAG: hypothetical protein J0M15_15530 [Deltaproteobacteria bacterium]|jgi:hypothetical protein|nr:hypothetical protein [Deltaproteobacteria bacterium]